ncbi:MAG: SRPBCC family protein [Solirubrobacteraceae bacterium]
MAQVTAVTDHHIEAPLAAVRSAIADYEAVRPRILTDHYGGYRVLEGGTGEGTVASWTLQATQKRSRDVVADVTVTDDGDVVETDRNSSMVTTWSTHAHGDVTHVTLTTTWKGAGGIGGFFEKTFAPKGLGRIQDELLRRLEAEVRGGGEPVAGAVG